MKSATSPNVINIHNQASAGSGSDAQCAQDHYTPFPNLTTPESVEELGESVKQYVHQVGFTDYFFWLPEADAKPTFLSSLPTALTDHYIFERMHKSDMLLYHGINQTKPIFASAVYEYLEGAPFKDASIERQLQIHHWFKSFGFYDVYVVPVPLPIEDDNAVLCFLSRHGSPSDLARIVEGQGVWLSALGEMIAVNLKYRLIGYIPPSETPRLNPKPLKVLTTLATGDLTIGDIAKKLNISVTTANKHLETARRTFAVKTNYEAIRKAVLAGLIELDLDAVQSR